MNTSNRFTDKNGKKRAMVSSVEAYKKLSVYEEAEEEGRLLITQFKKGQKLFRVWSETYQEMVIMNIAVSYDVVYPERINCPNQENFEQKELEAMTSKSIVFSRKEAKDKLRQLNQLEEEMEVQK